MSQQASRTGLLRPRGRPGGARLTAVMPPALGATTSAALVVAGWDAIALGRP